MELSEFVSALVERKVLVKQTENKHSIGYIMNSMEFDLCFIDDNGYHSTLYAVDVSKDHTNGIVIYLVEGDNFWDDKIILKPKDFDQRAFRLCKLVDVAI